jgi:hypothetical protein
MNDKFVNSFTFWSLPLFWSINLVWRGNQSPVSKPITWTISHAVSENGRRRKARFFKPAIQ